MKGVFWNSRGLRDLAKHRFLAEQVKEEQINFVAISETGRDSFPDHVLKNLCAGHDFLWHTMVYGATWEIRWHPSGCRPQCF
jgi:hypothetical protein